MNNQSSRSHTIFRIGLEIRPKNFNQNIVKSVINLIDLAGSEAMSKAKTEGIGIK